MIRERELQFNNLCSVGFRNVGCGKFRTNWYESCVNLGILSITWALSWMNMRTSTGSLTSWASLLSVTDLEHKIHVTFLNIPIVEYSILYFLWKVQRLPESFSILPPAAFIVIVASHVIRLDAREIYIMSCDIHLFNANIQYSSQYASNGEAIQLTQQVYICNLLKTWYTCCVRNGGKLIFLIAEFLMGYSASKKKTWRITDDKNLWRGCGIEVLQSP